MQRICIPEYGKISRKSIGGKPLTRLQRYDEQHVRHSGDTVFDWNHIKYVRAKNYVGVVQVPGLLIEILPKIDTSPVTDRHEYGKDDERKTLAQDNLLYMLCYTRKIPIREKDLAVLQLKKLPLLEALIAIFARGLLAEIHKGLHQSYIYREENRHYLKGKLLLNEHIRRNTSHKELVYVGFDEFISDTWLNRIFNATCLRLAEITQFSKSQQLLRENLLCFTEVSNIQIELHHFSKVAFNRNTERFKPFLDFCKLVLSGSAPSPSAGIEKTFNLLFPMERLFEDFIAQFLLRNASSLGLKQTAIHPQASKRRKWLLKQHGGKHKFQLRPDLIIDAEPSGVKTIIDTKWKHLVSDDIDSKNGVSQADLYQLYAYAKEYSSPDNILLYPKAEGVSSKSYYISSDQQKTIRTCFVNLNHDLRREKEFLLKDLRLIFK